MLHADEGRDQRFPLKNCSTGQFDLLIVIDVALTQNCSGLIQPPPFVGPLINLFVSQLPGPRLQVNVTSYSPLPIPTIQYLSNIFNRTHTNSSETDLCTNTSNNPLRNQQFKPWSVLPIFEFVHNYFSQKLNINENATKVAILALWGPNPGALAEITRAQDKQYNRANIKIFGILVNFLEEASLIELIPEMLHVPRYSQLLNNQNISVSLCMTCNPGWLRLKHSIHEISCYFINIDGDPNNWFTAYRRCQMLESNLASLESAREINFIEKEFSKRLTEIQSPDNFNVFIGLKMDYTKILTQFRWLSGNPLITSHWAAGYSTAVGVLRRCGLWAFETVGSTIHKVKLNYSMTFTNGWKDIDCDVHVGKASICEFVFDTSNRDEILSIEMHEADFNVSQYSVSKGEFLKYQTSIVSIPASAGNAEFYNYLEEMQAKLVLFNCDEDGPYKEAWVSYSYVCDHMQHCSNGRDEINCLYRDCDSDEEFRCASGQCVSRESRCDAYDDCFDGSDENDCLECRNGRSFDGRCLPDSFITYNGIECSSLHKDVCTNEQTRSEVKKSCAFICNRTSCIYPSQLNDGVVNCLGPEGQLDETIGKLVRAGPCLAYNDKNRWAPRCVYVEDRYGIPIGCRDMSHLWNCQNFTCPDGYIKCPGSFCIPMHLVHNGERNCPVGEDEYTTTNLTCAGNFACFGSKMCLHIDLVCDGVPHCPAGDDELNCHVSCADGFRCISGTVTMNGYNLTTPLNNLSFVDGRTRYLDLAGINISRAFLSQDMTHLNNLVVIRLSNCRITTVNVFFQGIYNLKTVQHFDLSNNLIKKIANNSVFCYMTNLRILNLSHNERLETLEGGSFLAYYRMSVLEILDLSYTSISVLHRSVLEGLNNLKTLNLSNTGMTFLYNTFPSNFSLRVLDLRDSSITNYDTTSFNGLAIRESLLTDNFGLCCSQIRGKRIPEKVCHAPHDTISSCSHLVRELVQRVLFWLVGAIAVLGNVAVIISRIMWDKGVIKKAYGIFVMSLGASDLIMGVYLIIIASADFYYRDNYILNGNVWKESTTCQVAGFLCTLSSETSAFFTLLVTLDRFIVMKFPFGQWNFSKAGMFTASTMAWLVGFVLAAIPSMPQYSGWTVYSSNSMCIGLPLNDDRIAGWRYSVSVFVALNSVIFLVIVIGQFLIYRAMSENRVSTSAVLNNNRSAQDVTVARQLSLIVLSNFLCWFPIGLMGLLALTGHEIGKSAYTWSAVLVMPINSALNPMLYTIPVLQGKLRQFISCRKAKRAETVKCERVDSTNIWTLFFRNKQ